MEEFELEPGEHVIREVRQHPFVFLLRLVPIGLLALAPFIVVPLFEMLLTQGGPGDGVSSHFRFFVGIWWLFLWMYVFHTLTKYFLTVWVITSHRIVDIHQVGLFRRKVSSFLLIRVQDVTTNIHGILQTLIGFGDINVETAGSYEKFCMKGIRAPEYIRDLIMREVALLHQDEDSVAVRAGV